MKDDNRWKFPPDDDFHNCGEISINADVMKLPMKVINYIILHELCHIEHKNHSGEFWKLLRDYMPEYQAIHDELGAMKV